MLRTRFKLPTMAWYSTPIANANVKAITTKDAVGQMVPVSYAIPPMSSDMIVDNAVTPPEFVYPFRGKFSSTEWSQGVPGAFALARVRERALALEHGHGLGRALGRAPDLGRAQERELGHDVGHEHELYHDRDHGQDFAPGLDRDQK